MFDFEVAVLGAGSAGFAAARSTAAAGLKTALIEGARELGGLCILHGCMPSKALLYTAEVLHLLKKSETWGLCPGEVEFDFAGVMRRKARLIQDFADYRRQQLEHGEFELIRANGRFLDPHRLELRSQTARGAKRTQLTARYIIIATGSSIPPAPLPSLEQVGYLTSNHALSLERLPKSLLVLGGGAIACELAQFFTRFGVKVTMIQRSSHVLKSFDADAASVIEQVFAREGIKLFTGTELIEARLLGDRKQIRFRHQERIHRVAAEEILLALGRSPNTSGLALQNAGVRCELNRIITDRGMRTSAPHIYAAGDCTGPNEIVHIAIQQAEIAAANIIARKISRKMDYRLLMNMVFTDPQLATVGLTERAAQDHQLPHLVAKYPFNDHGKSLIMEALDGFVKLLANPRTGEILGGCCVGPMGGELIHEITIAMARHLTVHELAALPHYHPTLAEIWTYPAEELAAKIPRSPAAGLRKK